MVRHFDVQNPPERIKKENIAKTKTMVMETGGKVVREDDDNGDEDDDEDDDDDDCYDDDDDDNDDDDENETHPAGHLSKK